MGTITKCDIERLGSRNFKVEMDCPNCGRSRLRMGSGNGNGAGDTECPKCGIRVILDTLNVTIINEACR